ncbi:MAG: superoxide dismutase family protein [Deltaproteobacteria bacterium]|nr:superoxide dismutase family protein [Deltaproteobacteria bacterium]
MKHIGIVAGILFLFGSMAYDQARAQTAKADLRNAKGEKVGALTLTQEMDGVKVAVEASNLPPGFHGFHIHAVGKCEPPFTSAGGHFNPGGQNHPHHAGDLPNLLVNADGKASAVLKTARFKVADLFDADGSALIIHADPDNHANIASRYRPDPDQATLSTGDAGGRIACGVISK